MATTRRFGKTRYGHAFSRGRFDGSWRGGGSRSTEMFPSSFAVGIVPTSSVPPTDKAKIGDLIVQKRALLLGCWHCNKEPRQLSPYEAAIMFGAEMRIPEVRAALQARCSREGTCELTFEPSVKPWNPRGVK